MHKRGVRFLALAVAVLSVTGTSARKLDVDVEESWQTTGGDVMHKLVNDLENYPIDAGRKLITFLRSNDYRIVRIQLSNEARGKQVQFLKSSQAGIHNVLKMLKKKDTESRAVAAELIHLLTTENAPLAQHFGLNAWLPESAGIKELLDMVDGGLQLQAEDYMVEAAEEAAQAVWAMMMHNADNLEIAHDRQGGEYFSNAILYSKSPRLKMWAAASLKRLVSDFYNTPDAAYSSTARKIVDNDRVRQIFGNNKELLQKLVAMIQSGRVTQSLPRAQWPTYVEVKDRESASIQAWAAAGALASLAQSEGNHQLIRHAGALRPLCELKTSPCALERVEALAALAALDAECSEQDTEEDWGGQEL